MTSRRPPGTRFETWVDQQIREAMERGEFEELDGRGRPIADLHEPSDELRWVRQKLKREGFAFLPPSLALRKEATEVRERARHARDEAEVRDLLDAINVKLLDAVRKAIAGPPVYVPPFDVEKAVAQWHADHPHGNQPDPEPDPDPPPRRRPWRHRTS